MSLNDCIENRCHKFVYDCKKRCNKEENDILISHKNDEDYVDDDNPIDMNRWGDIMKENAQEYDERQPPLPP